MASQCMCMVPYMMGVPTCEARYMSNNNEYRMRQKEKHMET
jgi:hypothetical protein